MECWHCERPAHGVCRFCGRGVCKDHAQKLPGIVSVFADQGARPKALVVPDSLHCGVCKPRGDPIDIGDLL